MSSHWERTLALFVLLAVALWALPALDDLERWTLDRRFQLRPSRPPPSDIVIVTIDQTQPWTKERPPFAWNPRFGRFIQAMHQASASCVLLDMLFSTTPDQFLLGHIDAVLASYAIPITRQVRNDLSFDFPLLQALATARKEGGLKVILGFPALSSTLDRFLSGLVSLMGPQRLGFFNISTDPDRVVRACVLATPNRLTGGWVPAVSLAVAAAGPGGGADGFAVASDGRLLVGGTEVRRLLPGLKGYIDFVGPPGTFVTESFQQVLDDAASNPARLARFAGKTVLVGVCDEIDYKITPTGFMYGIEIHANLIENIRRRSFLLMMPAAWSGGLLLALALVAASAFALGTRGAALIVPVVGLIWVAVAWALFADGRVLPLARPLLLLVGGSVLEGWRRYRSLEREKRKIRALFGRYVDDAVVEGLLRLPHEHLLTGSRRQICVMFSDIRGFTSFSENRDPAEVVRFLNTYFGGLTRIIQKHQGVVDKFLGDGLMAFFNAPLERESFAADAVRASLEMRAFVDSPEIRQAAGAFPLRVGIALHVGPAVVGNIGSERKVEFTAIGDTVNTASRLETLNKQYNTDIIASEELVTAAREGFPWKALGEQAIRGKERPVQLFTLPADFPPAS
ncbi:MAG: adenylate/guanylate cyclase domain-containing protein [Candidatus Riflebacteria bacterium]|nr:adenylate/guanylate cyclase domain-containing protein [Candidatus Riflebacteria bacterium]